MIIPLLDGQTEKLLQGQVELKQEIREVKTELNQVKSEILNLSLKVENEVTERIRGLYDSRGVQTDVSERILASLESIEAKIHVVQLDTFRALT